MLIHLNNDHPTRGGIDSKLNVGSARFDSDFPDDLLRRIAHELVFFVRQGLGRGYSDRVSGMDTHRIEVLDGTYDHDVILDITHDLKLEFFPSDHRSFNEVIMDRTACQSVFHLLAELLHVVGGAAASPAKRKRGPDDNRQTNLLRH